VKTGTPHEHGDGAKFLIAESSPVEGNLAVAIYVGGFNDPMLGTFNDRPSKNGGIHFDLSPPIRGARRSLTR